MRIGFSVNKRVGKAVIRNRVKRLMREAVRPHLGDLHPGQDVVFIARPQAADASLGQIKDAVSYVLCKTGASRQKPEARNA
jgi:ribonuclease P protein component